MITTSLDVAEAYHTAAIKAVARQYRALGYEVREEEQLPDIRADLVARRGSETLLIEVKVRSQLLPQEQVLTKLQAYAQQLSPPAQVRLVLVNPPAEKEIKLDNIEGSLLAWLQAHYAELEQLGPDVYPASIVALEVQQLTVRQGQLTAEGVCDVVVQYAATADFDPADEPELISLRFTAHYYPTSNQFLFQNLELTE